MSYDNDKMVEDYLHEMIKDDPENFNSLPPEEQFDTYHKMDVVTRRKIEGQEKYNRKFEPSARLVKEEEWKWHGMTTDEKVEYAKAGGEPKDIGRDLDEITVEMDKSGEGMLAGAFGGLGTGVGATLYNAATSASTGDPEVDALEYLAVLGTVGFTTFLGANLGKMIGGSMGKEEDGYHFLEDGVAEAYREAENEGLPCMTT